MPRFQHPSVFSDEHRAITLLDVIAPKCPLFDVLADFRRLPDDKAADGWAGLTVIDGRLHRIRGGGSKGGPRSRTLLRETGEDAPGVYARDLESGHVVELLAKKEAAPAVRLDLIDVLPCGFFDAEREVPGWDVWGDEPPSLTGYTITTDPMDAEEAADP